MLFKIKYDTILRSNDTKAGSAALEGGYTVFHQSNPSVNYN